MQSLVDITGLYGLDEDQQKAVYAPDGPLLILAGAGSGKTRSLIARIHCLIARGYDASSIMAITFTNKAADEIKSRLENYVGPAAHSVMAGTFHSVAHRLLRRHGHSIGLEGYRILDDDESRAILTRLSKLSGGSDDDAQRLISFVEDQKNKGVRPSQLEPSRKTPQAMIDLYRAYEAYLEDHNYVDFGNLIIFFNQMMNNPHVRAVIHSRFNHILIDEYQDINAAQYQMTMALLNENRNLWVVGDPDQSIYSWRGSDITHILNFQRDFPEARVIRLERNYRSTRTIVEATNQLIQRNKNRLPKTLWTDADSGDEIQIVYPANPNQEAAWVAQTVRNLIDSGHDPGQIAVLYRIHRQSSLLEESLVRRRIPFRVLGRTSFYDRQEIKDALAYLRLAWDIDDGEALLRILNTPRRGLGKKTQDFVAEKVDQGWSTERILNTLGTGEHGSPKSEPARKGAGLLLETLRSLPKTSAAEAVPEILQRSGLVSYYESDDDAATRLENLNRLCEVALTFGPWVELGEFVDELRLRSEEGHDRARRSVSLMTVHAAKGTEFDTVFVVGLEQGLFPLGGQEDREEERRLCYVALTRARRKLFLSSPMARVGRDGFRPSNASTFLSEMPSWLVDVIPRLEEVPS